MICGQHFIFHILSEEIHCSPGILPHISFSLIYALHGIETPAGKMKLEFLENPSSTLLGYPRISNLFQAHFWDFLEIACWYWPDLARIQSTKLGLGRISLNFK